MPPDAAPANMAEHFGDLELAPVDQLVPAISEPVGELGWWPSDLMLQLLNDVHLTLDVPWWGAIALTTVAMRLLLSPLQVMSMKNLANIQRLKPEMDAIAARLHTSGLSDETAKAEYAAQSKELYAVNECHPYRSLIMPVVQMPFAMALFFALKDMAETFPSVADGGALWFADLSTADASLYLPILSSAAFLATVELSQKLNPMPMHDDAAAKQALMMSVVMRTMAVLMIPLTMDLPAGVFVYILSATSCIGLQTAVLAAPSVKLALGVPLPPPPPPDGARARPATAASFGFTNPLSKEGATLFHNWLARKYRVPELPLPSALQAAAARQAAREEAGGAGERTADTLYTMAFVLRKKRKLRQAKELYLRCAALREGALGRGHAETGHALCAAAQVAAEDCERGEAAALFERAADAYDGADAKDAGAGAGAEAEGAGGGGGGAVGTEVGATAGVTAGDNARLHAAEQRRMQEQEGGGGEGEGGSGGAGESGDGIRVRIKEV